MIDKNYTIYHLHSDLSNGITNIDSVTKYKEYVNRAKECGMNALGFAEHGNIFEWYHKKCDIEEAGLKYIHGCEFYLTEMLHEDKKIRENYHIVLMARNYSGFLELNYLISTASNRNDGHFYYLPRITLEELFNTSDDIIITTACLGGLLAKDDKKINRIAPLISSEIDEEVLEEADKRYEELRKKYLEWLIKNKHRCFLEIQHHDVEEQKLYNKYLYEISCSYGIPLIAGTDTHCLNEIHKIGRKMLQKGKDVYFEGEDDWDLTFKTYDELVKAYEIQDSLDEETYLGAIENTNVLAEMVEEFELDTNTKYPKLYDHSEDIFIKHIYDKAQKHPYLNARYDWTQLKRWLDEEISVYKKTKSVDFMLLQEYLRDKEKEMGIQCGYSRGSVAGSLVAYALGITEIDSKKFGLNFFRFLNPDRVTNADIDTDYANADRERVKEYLLRDHMELEGLQCAEVITFNTIALRGAIKDIGRALGMEVWETQELSNQVYQDGKNWCIDDSIREAYPELFKYVDIVTGTIVSVGSHPSGIVVSDLDIARTIGLTTLSGDPYPVTSLNMKELDDLMYVKLDILGLDNIGVINETCKMVGIERLNPDNTDLEDWEVWKSIKNDTTMIFQWESNSAQAYLKELMSAETIKKVKNVVKDLSMIKWLSFGNGLIRPSCSSFRADVAKGNFYDNGMPQLNEFLAPTLGRIVMQEDIMRWLKEFCGYNDAEADSVRRAISKKRETENLLPEIEQRFIKYSVEHFGAKKEDAEKTIKPFLQVILDASSYGFSWNHSDSYSCIGYICGYLRYYYPLEFVTSALNIFSGDEEKTNSIIQYASKNKIQIKNIKYGYSKAEYFFDKETESIYKGIASIKYMNERLANTLYEMSKNYYDTFTDLLLDIKKHKVADSRQLSGLIQLDFFSCFGNAAELMRIKTIVENFKYGEIKTYKKEKVPEDSFLFPLFEKYSNGLNKNGTPSKSYKDIDCYKILIGAEMEIKKQKTEDYSFSHKIAIQQEFLGYISLVTDEEIDRPKLYVLKVVDAKAKATGNVFGKRIFCKSIGSGKESMFTIPINGRFDYKTKRWGESPWDRCGAVKEGYIIYVKKYKKNKLDDGRIFYDLLDYDILIE